MAEAHTHHTMKSKSNLTAKVVAASRKRGPYSSWQPVLLSIALSLPMSGCMSFCMDYSQLEPPEANSGWYMEGPITGQWGSAKNGRVVWDRNDPKRSDAFISKSLNAFPWAKTLPTEIFFDFVVSDSFLDEDSRPWRAEMYARFAPVVKDCKTRREAILAVAENAAKVCGVKYDTTRRAANQCVAESLESGKASCTGLSILLAAAYRSVGIPARLAGVGEWGDRPGNHTWVEVWDDDGWHFIEYYPDKAGLDHGWMMDPIMNLDSANPRSRVFAVDPAGETSFFLPWAPNKRSVKAVDRTEAYRAIGRAQGLRTKAEIAAGTGTVVFEARDASGKRVALDFRVRDGDTVVFAGRTPGPLDDLNNAPRRALKLNIGYTVEYADKTGVKRALPVAAKAGETTTLVLPAK